jgi:hypothetical protein
MSNELTSESLSFELAQFIGTEQYHFNPLYRWMKYTDGVKYFAEKAGAYWLLDIIGTEMQEIARRELFISIDFTVREGTGLIVADDGDGGVLYERVIGWTDCPEGTWKFFLCNSVLMLRSEY